MKLMIDADYLEENMACPEWTTRFNDCWPDGLLVDFEDDKSIQRAIEAGFGPVLSWPSNNDSLNEDDYQINVSNLDLRHFTTQQLTGLNFRNGSALYTVFGPVEIDGSVFSRADLTGSSFHKTKLLAPGIAEATMQGVVFDRALIKNGDFENADLDEAEFQMATVDGGNFFDATMKKAKFVGAKVVVSHFLFTDLSNALFDKTYIAYSYFQGAILNGADLHSAVLGRGNDFRQAKYDESTRFPAGFDPVRAGMVLYSEEEDDDEEGE